MSRKCRRGRVCGCEACKLRAVIAQVLALSDEELQALKRRLDEAYGPLPQKDAP